MSTGSVRRVGLTPQLVENFGGAYLSPMFDNPAPTAPFHREGWELYCSTVPFASLVAPRKHAKSTAFTHIFGLATICFRAQDYILIVSATERLAIDHLGDMSKELRENEDIRRDFNIDKLLIDSSTECVVRFKDGHEARIIAKGSGQKMRGLKWNGKRPGLIIGDDLEEDEQVENFQSRKKFRQWFNRALIPCLRKGGISRIHGTILHQDSMLARLQKASSWETLFFKAHRSFEDFRELLWGDQYGEQWYRGERQRFIDDDDASGYSQEYLNTPLDDALAFLKEEGFIPMESKDFTAPKRIKVGCDFAVSKSTLANRTSFTVGGETVDNLLCVIDQRVGRWDTEEWIDEMFSLQIEHDPEEWVVEGGVIWNAVWPMVKREMRTRGVWLNFQVINPVKDKATRALAFKKRHRAFGMRYADGAHWYPEYKAELKLFTGTSDALTDDQFDSTAIMVKGFEVQSATEEEDFKNEHEYDMEADDPRSLGDRDSITGY